MTEREAIESTFFDHCDTFRRVSIKDPDTKQSKQTQSPVLQNIPCALSQNKAGELSLSGDSGKAAGNYTLFHAPNVDIRKGDKVTITTASGQLFTLWAGKPFLYISHAETPLSEEEQ